jgi:TM2 domain-containing membrane protein YozV
MVEEKVEKVEGAEEPVSRKNRAVALILCLLFGYLGFHRFYVEKLGTGFLMMITFGGFGLWYFIDLILIIIGTFKDSDDQAVKEWFNF